MITSLRHWKSRTESYDSNPAAYGKDHALTWVRRIPDIKPATVRDLVEIRAGLIDHHGPEFVTKAGIAAELEATAHLSRVNAYAFGGYSAATDWWSR